MATKENWNKPYHRNGLQKMRVGKLSFTRFAAKYSAQQIQQKLSKVAAPDPFTSTSTSIKDGSRKIGENKLLTRPGSSRNRFQVRFKIRHLLPQNPLIALVRSRTRVNARTASKPSLKTKPSIVMVGAPATLLRRRH